MLSSILLVTLAGLCFAEFETCDRTYLKLGCMKRNSAIFPDLLKTNRDATNIIKYTGNMIDWTKYKESLHDLACKCSAAASAGGYKVFALGFYGECHAGKDKEAYDSWAEDSSSTSNKCIGHDYQACDKEVSEECIGTANEEYAYSFPDAAPEPINGGFNEWSEYTECSKTCGMGFKERERHCNNPVPANGGQDCSGDLTETAECQLVECPVDGGFSDWSDYDQCTASCGGGSQKRSRECTNPAPAYGGKLCVGAVSESQVCSTQPCPVNGGFTAWSSYGSCGKSCGGGIQKRHRSCSSPSPQHGGNPCVGAISQTQSCNTQSCPINGGFTAWSSYGSCSKTCGGGSQTKTRSCTSPSPQHGGNPCVGAISQTQSCNTQSCPINGGFTAWSSYGSCSKTCGGGSQRKTRSCTSPIPENGGNPCVGAISQTKSCNTEICLTSTDFENKIKSVMAQKTSESHSTFSSTLKNYLMSTYPKYYFIVDAYNPTSGWDNHAVTGYSYKAVFRQYNRNIVVGYTLKSSTVPSSSKQTEITSAVVNAITQQGRSARTSMDKAWSKATSYGYDIAMVHVVRFGNGLRSSRFGYTSFNNFVCDRSCNWLNQCTNHESSVVIMFGKA